VQLKLELLLNSIKNENSRYLERYSDIIQVGDEFNGSQVHYKNFFKTPLAVSNCVESMVGPTIKNIDDYGSLLILSEMLTFIYLKSIREQGGAYGAGCALDESGIISFYSYRDPQVDKTYLNFEKGIQEIIEGKFSTQQLDESKLLAF
jgi:presequence protease